MQRQSHRELTVRGKNPSVNKNRKDETDNRERKRVRTHTHGQKTTKGGTNKKHSFSERTNRPTTGRLVVLIGKEERDRRMGEWVEHGYFSHLRCLDFILQ